jgi:amidase
VRNPYDLERDPGASSSGTAVAVAANLVMVGVASDSAGSVRLPASFCNIVGFRPTVGLISRYGSSPGILGQTTHGPMGRTVADVARMMDALSGFDEKDSMTAVHAVADALGQKSFAADLQSLPGGSAAKVGVIRGLFGKDTEPAQATVNRVINRALDSLRQSGVEVVDVDIPGLEDYLQGTSHFLTRARYDLDQWLKPNLGVTVAEIVSSGRCPPENVMIPFISKNGLETPYESGEYGKQVDLREEFQRTVLTAMLKHGVSALAFPSVKIPPPRYADIDIALRAYLPLNTGFASQLRWPSICVPAGFTSDDLPVGMEISGPPLQDRVLLSWAYRVEQTVKARRAPTLKAAP